MNLGQIIIPFLLTLLAGLSTVAGSLIFLSHAFCKRKIGYFLGLSAGVMIYLSFVELLPYSIKGIGFLSANVYFFIGVIAMALVDFFLPHHCLEERICRKQKIIDQRLLSTGLVVTIGLIIHNFPEGMAVFLSSFTNVRLGVLLAIAIAIHNIPEGIAVAAPIYYSTQDKGKAVKYAFISGMAEPLGAIIAYLLLKPYLNQNILSYIFALVAGIMVYISFDELLPASF
ncbi:zinc transporter ZupT, partial [Patescibacteria group bacterium]|nr:zinc transporter ZupT [Patescibacteria group bacterium]